VREYSPQQEIENHRLGELGSLSKATVGGVVVLAQIPYGLVKGTGAEFYVGGAGRQVLSGNTGCETLGGAEDLFPFLAIRSGHGEEDLSKGR